MRDGLGEEGADRAPEADGGFERFGAVRWGAGEEQAVLLRLWFRLRLEACSCGGWHVGGCGCLMGMERG